MLCHGTPLPLHSLSLKNVGKRGRAQAQLYRVHRQEERQRQGNIPGDYRYMPGDLVFVVDDSILHKNISFRHSSDLMSGGAGGSQKGCGPRTTSPIWN